MTEKDFSRKYKSLEFRMTAGAGILFLPGLFYLQSLVLWQIGICVMASLFIIGRSIFKRNRTSLLCSGADTSEFKVALASVSILGISCFLPAARIDVAYLCTAIIVGSFSMSRGITKSFTVSPQLSTFP